MALISEFTNQNACKLNVMARFHPHLPNCDTGPSAKDQESRSRTQGPCAGGNQGQCMLGQSQGPRAEDQRARVTRTKNQGPCRSQGSCWGQNDKKRMSSACMRQTRQTRGPAPHAGPRPTCRDPHACMEGHSLHARIESIIASSACHCDFFNSSPGFDHVQVFRF